MDQIKEALFSYKDEILGENPFSDVIANALSEEEEKTNFYTRIDQILDDIPFPESIQKEDVRDLIISETRMMLCDKEMEIKDAISDVVNERESYSEDDDCLAAISLDEKYLELDAKLSDIRIFLDKIRDLPAQEEEKEF